MVSAHFLKKGTGVESIVECQILTLAMPMGEADSEAAGAMLASCLDSKELEVGSQQAGTALNRREGRKKILEENAFVLQLF